MLESGEVRTMTEIAEREGIDNSYVSRMVNLTTLAPDIVAAILENALPDHLTLFEIAVDPPWLWETQRAQIVETEDKIQLGIAGRTHALPTVRGG